MNSAPLPRLALISILVLALGACSKPEPVAEARLVLATQAQNQDGQSQLFAGEVRARQEVNLAFRVPGKVAKRNVDAGARVQAGQILASLDDQDLTLQSQASQASVAALKADRDLAAAELSRYRQLVGQKLVSQSLYDSKVAQAKAALSRYQQSVAQSQVNANQTAYAIIRAPGAGVISQRFIEAGQVVSAGQPIFTFAADGARDVAITVAEQHLSAIKIGQTVWVELWTRQGQHYPAKIREISAAADELTRTYAVRVALDDADAQTQLGQSARVLLNNQQGAVLSLPLSAVSDKDGKPMVWVIDTHTGKIHQRLVTVARYGAVNAEISQGLSQDDWVVQAGVHLLREGELVKAVDRSNRPVASVVAKKSQS